MKAKYGLIFVVICGFGFILRITGYVPFNTLKGYSDLNHARHLLMKEQYDEAIPLLKRSIELSPRYYEAYYLLGLNETEPYARIEYYKKAEELNPQKITIPIFLSSTYIEVGDTAAAYEQIAIAKNLAPADALMYGSLTGIYQELEDWDGVFDAMYNYSTLTSDEKKRLMAISNLNKVFPYLQKTKLSVKNLSGNPKQHTVVVDKNGKLHAVGFDKTFPKLLLYQTSRDFGKTWTNERILYSGNQKDATLLLDSKNIAHIFFGGGGGPIYYAKSSDYEVITIAENGSNILAINRGSQLDLIWQTDDGNYGGNIVSATIQNGVLSDSLIIAYHAENPALAVSDNGYFYLVYNTDTVYPDKSGRIHFITKEKAGNRSNPVVISRENTWAGGANIVVDKNEIVHVVYLSDFGNNQLQLYYQNYKNGVWTDPHLVSDKDSHPYLARPPVFISGRISPAICVSTNNDIYILWRSTQSKSGSPAYLSMLSKDAWANHRLTGDFNLLDSSYYPTCFNNPDGYVYYSLINDTNTNFQKLEVQP